MIASPPNRISSSVIWSWRLACICSTAMAAMTATTLHAQSVAPDAATLAKYDKNHNGRLDADELATMQADQAKAAKTPVVDSAPRSGDEVVQLSPFEVIDD